MATAKLFTEKAGYEGLGITSELLLINVIAYTNQLTLISDEQEILFGGSAIFSDALPMVNELDDADFVRGFVTT